MERGQGLENIDAKPRRMLQFTVSDGETDLRAIEYYSIKRFSLLTKPGSKILLIPPVSCRKGVLLLKPENVQLLGGDVESLFMAGRPLQVMAEKLGITIPNSNSVRCRKQVPSSGQAEQRAEPKRAKTGIEAENGQVMHIHCLLKCGVLLSKANSAAKPVIIPTGPEAPILHDEDYDFDPAEFEQEETPYGEEDVDLQSRHPDDQIVPDSPLPVDTRDSCRFSPVFPAPICSGGPNHRPLSKPVAQISPMKPTKNTSKARSKSPPCNMELEETPPDFDAELVNLASTKTSRLSSSSSSDEAAKCPRASAGHQFRTVDKSSPSTSEDLINTRKRPSTTRVQPSLISLCDSQAETSGLKRIPCASFDPSRRSDKLGIQGFLKSVTSPAERQSNGKDVVSESTRKKVKVEVIDIEDDDDVNHDTTTTSFSPAQPCRPFQNEPEASSLQCDPQNALLMKFQKLNIVRIADASKQMRFAVGSCRKTVQAIISDIIDSLRIVDGMWTMKVSIQDESVDGFVCLVDSPTLSSLIGLTPSEAMEVRASSDIERRKDGQRRLGAVEEQLKRLDLLLELELFSGGRADPVIRSIRTLMQALDVL
ncbi:hypothetical protein OSTOST_07142 [Ostertagia ostertagi]